MYKKALLLFLLYQLRVLTLSAQDIHSSSPVVLPQSPSTSYIISAGQTVKVSSAQSVTLGPGTWFQSGSSVTIQVANSPVITPAPSNPALNSDKNWVYEKTYDENGIVIGESKTFYDTNGKDVQTQIKSISAGHVLATQTLYDALGRSAIQTLAAPINNSAFSYKAGFVTNSSGIEYAYNNFDLVKTNSPDVVGNSTQGTLGWYYSNNNSIDPYVPVTAYPYSRVDFYSDGTGAVKRSASIGDQLRMGSGREERSYSTPVANELDYYLQVRNKFFSAASVGERPTSMKDEAVQNIVHDANGKEALVVVDKSGNVLMSGRPGTDLTVSNTVTLTPDTKSIYYFKLLANGAVNIQGAPYKLYDMTGNEQEISLPGNKILNSGYYKVVATGLANESITVQYNNGYADLSYNFYNESGQLLANIAPNGVKQLLTSGLTSYTTLASVPFVSTYEYDLMGRRIANTQPDAGRTEYIYRKDGKIRFSQNSVQRSANPIRFSYVNYDRWGRLIESGEYVQGTITFAAAKTNTTLQESIAADGGLTSGSKLSQVKSQYDVRNNTHGLTAYVQDEGFLKGALSYTENGNAKTWYNYDGDGRLIWLIRQITGLGNKTIDYIYDAKGNVAKVDFQKDNSAERFTHEYEYDTDNRLKIVYTSTATSGRKEQARYYYYLHGPLKRVELADNLQGIDYTYTAQGWLKSINHPTGSNDPGKDGSQNGISEDAFGMTLEYFSGDYVRNNTGITSLTTGGTASYNGNIMAQSWKSLKPQAIIIANGAAVNNPAMVTYAYDDKYQFSSNKYGAPNFTSNSFAETLNANKEYNLSYDANGNIKTLSRNNAAGAATANFSYTYLSNTNKLSSVGSYTTYTYDSLGQTVGQVRNGGQGYYLNYDVNGKVNAIYSDAAKTQLRVSFAYDENGMRIKKTDHLQNVTSYYVYDGSGNELAIYDNKGSVLQQKEVPIYAATRLGTYNRPGNNYLYELTDHLGNVRVVINGTKTAQGQTDVVTYSDYYPFGSPLTLAGNDYRYGYQGQYAELDKETGWNSFDLRMYDPAIGRWMSTDPYGQYASPYIGMGNNSVSSVDPDGGYSIIGAAWRQGLAFLIGANPSKIYNNGNTWGFNTGSADGVVGHFSDPAPFRIQEPLNNYIAMHSERGMGRYNEFAGQVNNYSGRADASYPFEELLIGGAVTKGIGLAFEGIATKTGLANSKAMGSAMEQALGMSSSKTAINIGGRTRFPDRLANGLLEESKNVKHLNFTGQLRDYLNYSQQNGLQMILHTRPSTTFSKPLQQLINNGTIIHNKVPGF